MGTQNALHGKKIFVAGHGGMVGQALVRALTKVDCHLITATRQELDLQDQRAVRSWFEDKKPDVVFLAAAKVGGILANSLYPADFIHDNLLIQQNVIGSAHLSKVKRLVFLGSSCIYPRLSPQPIREDSLLSGPLEETNQWYAIAKIAGLKLVEAFRRQYGVDYISIMPTNLYGPGDTYDAENSHVIPALILKFHEAKINKTPHVSLWGTGNPKREFLYVDDLADACLFLANNYSDMDPINVGVGQDISIKDLSEIVAKVVGYDGAITFEGAKLDGTPRKLLDTTKLSNYGWTAKIPLEKGLELTYQNFLTRYSS